MACGLEERRELDREQQRRDGRMDQMQNRENRRDFGCRHFSRLSLGQDERGADGGDDRVAEAQGKRGGDGGDDRTQQIHRQWRARGVASRSPGVHTAPTSGLPYGNRIHLPGARTGLFPCPQNGGGPPALFRETEGVAHGLGFHQLVEEILVMRGGFEQCVLLFRVELARAVAE